MAEPKGKYVRNGDVEEWVWDKDGPGAATDHGGWVGPESEFDPTSVETGDLKSASEKVAEAAQAPGFRTAEAEEEEKEAKKVTTKTAAPLVGKK